MCQSKIQCHSSTRDEEITSALEYIVDKVPYWFGVGISIRSFTLLITKTVLIIDLESIGEQLMSSSQINFTGESLCPTFTPNSFKKDLCQLCQSKIQCHSSASDEEIAAALEYTVDKVPSLIWSYLDFNSNLYVGGYKSGLNRKFLMDAQIGLIVDTAPSLIKTLGPKYEAQRTNVRAEYNRNINVISLDWEDKVEQRINPDELKSTLIDIENTLSNGRSVLIHCAQGKSRSSAVAVAFLSAKLNISIEEALNIVQKGRKMAQPNSGFIKQLSLLKCTLLTWK